MLDIGFSQSPDGFLFERWHLHASGATVTSAIVPESSLSGGARIRDGKTWKAILLRTLRLKLGATAGELLLSDEPHRIPKTVLFPVAQLPRTNRRTREVLGQIPHRAPVLSTQKMPSRTTQSMQRGRPKVLVSGSNGWIRPSRGASSICTPQLVSLRNSPPLGQSTFRSPGTRTPEASRFDRFGIEIISMSKPPLVSVLPFGQHARDSSRHPHDNVTGLRLGCRNA